MSAKQRSLAVLGWLGSNRSLPERAALFAAAARCAIAATQQGQLTTELAQHNFGRVAIRARLVLPFAG